MNETLFHDTLRWARLGALLGSVLWMTACGGGGSGGAPPAATPAPSVVALFAGPSGVATDSLGNVYVADGNNHTIRKVTPGGVVSTLAGSAGLVGSADGSGAAARFHFPRGVATDSLGNVYVADESNHTIRKITSGGVVSTLAGSAGLFSSADGSGAAARFSVPSGVATDSAGNVYVADSSNHTIRKVTPAGVVTTLAGLSGYAGTNDGTGSAARFYNSLGVAVDGATNLYVADTSSYTIRKLTARHLDLYLRGEYIQTGTSSSRTDFTIHLDRQ